MAGFMRSIAALLLVAVRLAKSDDVMGCGGFIRSNVTINYSRVEVKLLTRQGSQKYQTEGAPNNGYYLIPLYDRGDYTLRVDPPPGWVFEPASVDLHIDGTTDPCSTAQDINFVFKGFSIVDKVLSDGQQEGPPGVTVELRDNQGRTLQKTLSTKGGGYVFTRILPGEYTLVASHPIWSLGRSSTTVKVIDDNGTPTESLVVAGYDVRGEVFGEGDPIRGVHFVLASDKSETGAKVALRGCEDSPPRGFSLPAGLHFLCTVTSGSDGQFVFPAVPPGSYKLLPFYKAERIEFDIAPRQAVFSVKHGGHRFPNKFQVQGFSVSGKVRVSEEGPGVPQAEVFLGGSRAATTDASGTFHLENMKAGQYVIHVKAPGMTFDPFPVRVSPNTPELPAIVASQFEVCGTIEGASRRIIVEGSKEPSTVIADSSGKFCTALKAGKYVLRPFVGKEEEASGLRFVPADMSLDVPVVKTDEVAFKRFRAEIRGKVACIKECGQGLKVFLRAANLPEDAETATAEVQPDGSFHFAGLSVGKYRLWVDRPEWCWEHDRVGGKLHAVDEAVSRLTLQQTGFRATVVSSHATRVEVVHTDDSAAALNLEVPAGSSRHCLPKQGTYAVRPVGCHEFREKDISFDTSQPTAITLTVSRHTVGGIVIAEENVTDLVVMATLSGASTPVQVVPSAPVKHAGDKFLFRFSLMLAPLVSAELVPRSGRLLFSPPALRISVGNDCAEEAARFRGAHWPFCGWSRETTTGRCACRGSRHGRQAAASKDGYVLRPLDKLGHFEAFKYAEVKVTVSEAGGQPLAGVLVSLSGATDYRNHSRTREDGRLRFPNLSPGNYFLRPMMKEYRFSPASKMLTVGEGATVKLDITGDRVAFSCLGLVSSVTGEAEPGVSLEALGTGTCQGHQEEALSDNEGAFRLRGLLPGCAYQLQLKPGANPHIERAEPPKRELVVTNADLTNVRVIVFRFFNQMDITGQVVTDPKHLPSLKIRVVVDDAPEQTLHTVTPGPGGFFLLPPLTRDGRTYCLQLEGSSNNGGTCFHGNTSHRHVTLRHAPELPPHLEHEIVARSSLLALPVTVVALLACYYSSRLLTMGADVAQTLRTLVKQISGTAKNTEGATGSPADTRRKAKARRT
ncbi:LOW QUALITY PROTEIN: nodal modulator 1-like [Rhipicephalus sanguineus]|uniref:LOW QUALITY PROTEIN: nodal modulator 1-like n=1 Tax=Rhipicephalus sanguineus TaxID=34632 RepID=UPI0020C37042|nr:LOW QUALITY PROTEIN: nodal modulator 1-like [Rhipicephalus sanguineus]